MDFGTSEFRLLKKSQAMSFFQYNDEQAVVTDFAILLGAFVCDYDNYHVRYDHTLKGRTGWWFLDSVTLDGSTRVVYASGGYGDDETNKRSGCVRPAINDPSAFFKNLPTSNSSQFQNGIKEFQYGEYPQYAVDEEMQGELEYALLSGYLFKTGKTYTTDSRYWNEFDAPFKPIEYEEYEYNDKKYVRVLSTNVKNKTLTNGMNVTPGDPVWVEVSPITWIMRDDYYLAISKRLIAAGIRIQASGHQSYDGDFEQTEMYTFLNKYFARDIVPSNGIILDDMTPEEKAEYEAKQKEYERRRNPYGLNFDNVSEEDIIKGMVESGVAVFLHGQSSEGKSARVKQIDPTCVIIYLRNSSPESLNGKSVYNQATGEMIDVKPTWLRKLEEKCEQEPDRLHIVFFDEITNALPSIQGIAFNIVLDREVNGIWKLPENARIVAAGNDMQDSLAANQLAEPLFNRFAHVYIKTTTENWLKWAAEHHIHPAIYSYIAYKHGEVLRSKFDGEKPNADPRKWEMASKVLYATGNPEMLRSLVGEEITNEFVEFCKQQVITLEDVINGNYNEREIALLNTSGRYATTMGLSQVDEENVEVVRDFINKLGAEFKAIFDALWTNGDEHRLEKIAELKLAEGGRS